MQTRYHQLADITGRDLVEWRKKNRHTQEQAADAIGVSKKAWYSWECGIQPIPKRVYLAILGLSVIQEPREHAKQFPRKGVNLLVADPNK